MHEKVRALLLSAFAVTGLTIVTTPPAHADSFTQVGFGTGSGRQVYLWRNNANGCLHAQGKSLRNGDKVRLLMSTGDGASATANAEGVTVSTPSRCTKHGTDYWGFIDLRTSEEGPETPPYRNF